MLVQKLLSIRAVGGRSAVVCCIVGGVDRNRPRALGGIYAAAHRIAQRVGRRMVEYLRQNDIDGGARLI